MMGSEALDEQTIREIVRDELDESEDDSSWTRRGVLAALGIGGAVATGSSPASAATPDGYLGSASDPLGAYLADVRGPGNGDAITFQQEIDTPALQADTIDGVGDAICHDGDDIDNFFGSNLSSGDTLLIEQPATPYRNNDWLDIDVSDVTVTFESRWAEDGQPVVKVADNADVGGIRVGHNAAVDNITVNGHGHDGNEANQDNTVKNLDAIQVGQNGNAVTEFHYERFYHTRTHPWQEHSTGGSGVSANDLTDYTIRNGIFYEIGDRCIQTGGDWGRIESIYCESGFDRVVATDQGNGASNLTVVNAVVNGIADGTAFRAEDPIGAVEHHTYENLFVYDADKPFAAGNNAQDVTFRNVHGYNCTEEMIGLINDGATDITIENAHGWADSNASSIPPHVFRVFGSTPPENVTVNGMTATFSGINNSNSFRGYTIGAGSDLDLRNIKCVGEGGVTALYIDTSDVVVEAFITHNVGRRVNVNSGTPVINGDAAESANAETPQGRYPIGTLVRFTDSGDGSGTGTYLVTRTGGLIQVASTA
jgi:hypothetical protein